jgi:heme O synthase-like polyprenyltransferase
VTGAALLGAGFIGLALQLHRRRGTPQASRLFRYSIVYLFSLFLLMTVDAALRLRA